MSIEIDISEPDFDQWVRQVFDNPVVPEGQSEWYFADDLEFVTTSPRRLVQHFTRLCQDFGAVVAPFSLEQVDQGIWYLLAAKGDFGSHLMDLEIPREERLSCIRSMIHVYSDYVALLPSDVKEPSCFFMWWDMLCDSFRCAVREPVRPPTSQELHRLLALPDATTEERQERARQFRQSEPSREEMDEDERNIHDVMFETLAAILALSDPRCHSAALHGLGHLRHPRGREIVQRFIDSSPNRLEFWIRWLERCRDGTVM